MPQLEDLIWSKPESEVCEVETGFNDYILRGEVYMVPIDHPNISFILVLINEHHWYDDEVGPFKFIKYI